MSFAICYTYVFFRVRVGTVVSSSSYRSVRPDCACCVNNSATTVRPSSRLSIAHLQQRVRSVNDARVRNGRGRITSGRELLSRTFQRLSNGVRQAIGQRSGGAATFAGMSSGFDFFPQHHLTYILVEHRYRSRFGGTLEQNKNRQTYAKRSRKMGRR